MIDDAYRPERRLLCAMLVGAAQSLPNRRKRNLERHQGSYTQALTFFFSQNSIFDWIAVCLDLDVIAVREAIARRITELYGYDTARKDLEIYHWRPGENGGTLAR